MSRLKEMAHLMKTLEANKRDKKHGLDEGHWEYCQHLVGMLIEHEQQQPIKIEKHEII